MKKLSLILGTLLLLTACTTTNNVSSYNRTSEVAQSNTKAAVQKAIIDSATERGWKVKNINSNTIQGVITAKGGISATTNVTYSANSYDFKLVKSTGLSQKGDVIHRRYNNWIQYWDTGIKNRLENN